MGTTGFAVALMVVAAIITTYVDGKGFSDHQEIKIQRLLKQLNKPALKSIKSEDGDIIDCVLITSQPAFDNPLLKDHTIEMRPSFIPEDDSTYPEEKEKDITQVWHKNGEFCPENTIPIRRVKREDILRAQSIDSFGKKTSSPRIHMVTSLDPLDVGHEYAIQGVLGNKKVYGTKASMNIWNPKVEVRKDFSLAQIWLVSGESKFNSIEVGWQVCPQIYGDNNTRLFVYWTRDGQKDTGCYNLKCQGFVQTGQKYAVGTSFTRVSQYGGPQEILTLLVWKGTKGNWWLKIGNEIVGYWPGSLFNSLGNGATQVMWGGEIYTEVVNRHTTTDMGSGHFADEGFKKKGTVGYFKNLKIVDEKNTLKEPGNLYTSADNINCYNVKTGSVGTSWGIHFFYGGPGRNRKCP